MKIVLLILLVTSYVIGQDLDSVKIYINPGHGGHDSDDRYIPQTGFYESDGNLTKGLKLRDILSGLNGIIEMSRTQNRTVDDKALSTIVAEANAFEADYFHAIHSNGYQGTANYTLMLFQGFDNGPTYPEAKAMGAIMVDEIYRAHRTTAKYNRGDFDFYGTGAPYLGVFKGLLMPGTLSEGSFHDYIPESWRLMNLYYREHESWAMARSFLQFYNIGTFSFGEIAGVVRDTERIVNYYYLSYTSDARVPVNNLKVTLLPGNRIYNGDAYNNGFFLFDSLSPGTYKLIYEAPGYFKDSSEVVVVANQTVFADKNLVPFTPDVPEYVRVLRGTDGTSLIIQCDPAARASGYRALVSMDGVTFVDSVESMETSISVDGLQENQVYYFKVKATNTTGASAPTQELFAGVPSANPHQVLIVNGFDRSSNTRHDYIRKYADPVNSRGYPFSCTLNETVYANKVSLPTYKIVIWILGNESSVDDSFNPSEQAVIQAFLRGGGSLFVSGSEIGWDLEGKTGHPSTADIDFYHNFFKAQYIADAPFDQGSTYYTIQPMTGSIFDGITEFNFDNGTHGTFNVDWPDAITAINGGQNVFKFKNVTENNGVGGIIFEGQFPNGRVPGKLIYLTFPFETVYPEEKRTEVMSRSLDFFAGMLSLENMDKEVPETYTLYQNYPNPFNPVTHINFALPNNEQVSLRIYDLLGRLIMELVNEKLAAGRYQRVFDASALSSGTYIYTLQTGNFRQAKKMVVLK